MDSRQPDRCFTFLLFFLFAPGNAGADHRPDPFSPYGDRFAPVPVFPHVGKDLGVVGEAFGPVGEDLGAVGEAFGPVGEDLGAVGIAFGPVGKGLGLVGKDFFPGGRGKGDRREARPHENIFCHGYTRMGTDKK